MPESYHIDGEHKLVVTVVTGVLNEVELREHYNRLRADTHFTSNLISCVICAKS